jgi:hypothetical protein
LRLVWLQCWLKLHNGYSNRSQAEVAQQQAQQAQQDPIVQMQQQELQIKMAEQQRKAAKDQMGCSATTATTAD